MSDIFIETKRLIISPLSKSNYEIVTNLYAAHSGNSLATGIFSDITAEEVERRLDLSSQTKTDLNIIAEHKDKKGFVGFLRASLYEESNNAWFRTFIISEPKRREGYGREFINAFCEHLRDCRGIRLIGLSVMDMNSTGKMFWESVGFDMRETLMKSGIVAEGLSKINIYVKLF